LRAYHFTFAWVHAERGEIELGRQDFDAAFADGFASLPRDVNWLDAMGAAANAAVLLGDAERSSELRTLLEPYADRMIVNARGSLHAGSVAYVLARLAAAAGDDSAADHRYQHATERDQHAGDPARVLRDPPSQRLPSGRRDSTSGHTLSRRTRRPPGRHHHLLASRGAVRLRAGGSPIRAARPPWLTLKTEHFASGGCVRRASSSQAATAPA
jgi:hypothetical protein